MENITTIAKDIKTSLQDREKSITKITQVISESLDNTLVKDAELLKKCSEHFKTNLENSIDNLNTVKDELARVKQEHEKIFVETATTLNQVQQVIEQKKSLATLVIFLIMSSVFVIPLMFKIDSNNFDNYIKRNCTQNRFNICYNVSDTKN